VLSKGPPSVAWELVRTLELVGVGAPGVKNCDVRGVVRCLRPILGDGSSLLRHRYRRERDGTGSKSVVRLDVSLEKDQGGTRAEPGIKLLNAIPK